MNFTMGTEIGALGNPGNTGDGLRLAQSMGAKLWHMNAYSAGLDVQYPGYSTNVAASLKGAGYIWVDQEGRRFANELTDGHCQMYLETQLDAVNHRYPRIPCFLVFDDATLKMGLLGSSLGSGWAINREHHTWSAECKKEIEMGLVKKRRYARGPCQGHQCASRGARSDREALERRHPRREGHAFWPPGEEDRQGLRL